MSTALMIALATSIVMLLGALVWWRSKFPPLPAWGWRNIIALIALAASIAGAAILTALIWAILDNLGSDADRLITELTTDPKARPEIGQVLVMIYKTFKDNLTILTLGLLVILVGFGFAISARRFSGEWLGGKIGWSGGDEDEDEPPEAAAAKQVAQAAVEEAKAVAQNGVGTNGEDG